MGVAAAIRNDAELDLLTLIARDLAAADPGVQVLGLQDELHPLNGRHSRLGDRSGSAPGNKIIEEVTGRRLGSHALMLLLFDLQWRSFRLPAPSLTVCQHVHIQVTSQSWFCQITKCASKAPGDQQST